MKFHHISLTVKDFDTSISFYQDFFNYREIKRFRRDDMKAIGCFLQSENLVIELWQFDDFKKGIKEDLSFVGIKHFAFTDDNPTLVRDLFLSKGINCSPLSQGASGGIYFFLSDPDGNQIEIYKPNI